MVVEVNSPLPTDVALGSWVFVVMHRSLYLMTIHEVLPVYLYLWVYDVKLISQISESAHRLSVCCRGAVIREFPALDESF